jgi:hypothetical protein
MSVIRLTSLIFLISALLPFKAFAAVGDIYIARAPATSLVSNNSLSTAVQLTYDSEVATSSIIERQTGNKAFRIKESGRYLIISSTGWDYEDVVSNIFVPRRHVVRTNVKLGGSNLSSIMGMSSGYGRTEADAEETHVITISYIDHTINNSSDDDITVEVQNFGNTASAEADQLSNASGLMIVRMPDDAAWTQVTRTTDTEVAGGGLTNSRAADSLFTTVLFENRPVQTDSSVIEYSCFGLCIKLKESGHYLVLLQVQSIEDNDVRNALVTKLMLNDSNINGGTMISSYHRAFQFDDAEQAWVSLGVIIEASANDQLSVDVVNDAQTTTEDPEIEELSLTVIRLPDSADYVRIYNAASQAGELDEAFPMSNEDEDDGNLHSISTNTDRINGTSAEDDWLFLAGWNTSVTSGDTTVTTEHLRWSRTEVIIQYGSGLSYTRGRADFSGESVHHSGRAAAVIVHNLGSSEWIGLNLRQESGTGDQGRDTIANRYGITALNLTSMAKPKRRSAIIN